MGDHSALVNKLIIATDKSGFRNITLDNGIITINLGGTKNVKSMDKTYEFTRLVHCKLQVSM